VLDFEPVDEEVLKEARDLADGERLPPPQEREWVLLRYLYEGVLESEVDPQEKAEEAWFYIKNKIRPLLTGELFRDLWPDAVALDMVRSLRQRQAPIELTGIKAPPHWEARSRQFLEECRELQLAIQRRLGMSRTLRLDEMEAFFSERAARMPPKGTRLNLWYPFTAGGRRGLRRATVWSDGDPGLTLLAQIALEIRMAFGCEEWELVGFLLSDLEFQLPWIRLELVKPSTSPMAGILEEAGLSVSTLPRVSPRDFSLIIEVGSSLLPAETLRQAYMQARRDVLEKGAEPGGGAGLVSVRKSEVAGLDPRRVQRVRGQNAATVRLIQWVEEGRKAGLTWQQVYDQWPAEDGLPSYMNRESMQQTYYRATKKRAEWYT
jgi:hypothetical protein